MRRTVLFAIMAAGWSGSVAMKDGTTYVYVSGGSDQVRVFTLNAATGAIALKSMVPTGPLRPGDMAFSPDKKTVYGVGEVDAIGRLSAYRINAADGALTKLTP